MERELLCDQIPDGDFEEFDGKELISMPIESIGVPSSLFCKRSPDFPNVWVDPITWTVVNNVEVMDWVMRTWFGRQIPDCKYPFIP